MATKELQAIIAAWTAARLRGERAALVTVVRTAGSTYRRPGARMLVLSGGASAGLGLISGGCLEDDARERALEAIAAGESRLIRYDTTADGDIVFGSGVGCQGIVHVLIQPLPKTGLLENDDDNPLSFIANSIQGRRTGVLASVFGLGEPSTETSASSTSPRLGDFLWLDAANVDAPTTNGRDRQLAAEIAHDGRKVLRSGKRAQQTYRTAAGANVEVFLDVIKPPRALLVCGAGEDAIPLARLGVELGWRVRVADPRPAYATRERFPTVDEVIVCPAGAFKERIPIEPGEAAVLMTHNYHHDLAILQTLLASPAGYIGALGPSRRTKRLLADLAAEEAAPGSSLSRQSLRRLWGPAGLDIGAETPDEIALSIIAEIEAVGAGRRGGVLRRRRGPLHGAAVVMAGDALSGT